MKIHPSWLHPSWHGEHGIGALMTTRHGGVSTGPWSTMNLGDACGDRGHDVTANRAGLGDAIGARLSFIRQVHGCDVVEMTSHVRGPAAEPPLADGCFTTERGVACAVLAADCMPVLFAAPQGKGVAAAHAGWRGLAAGVVEATLSRLCKAAGCEPAEVRVWLGACIGPARFEVGPDVLEAFDRTPGGVSGRRFRPQQPGKWLADLPGLARDRLQALGVEHIEGGQWCTVSDAGRFFSYRRDGVTGRMAACIWISPPTT